MWTQLILSATQLPDTALLLRVADALEPLREQITSWHYFWEPGLWVRVRWASANSRADGEAQLAARLEGLAPRFEAYDGDAARMGAEMWPYCERDFHNGAELAVALHRHERDGTATKSRDFHWARHVHTFSNQLCGTWAEEARLCAVQARYRAWLLTRVRGTTHGAELARVVAALDAAIAALPALEAAESELLAMIRARSGDDAEPLLDLPPDFDRDPSSVR